MTTINTTAQRAENAGPTSVHEPGRLEVFITLLAGKLSGRIYAEYIARLPLAGNERMLDFGSGAGTPALSLAQRLQAGGGRLTCIDISHTWLKIARRRLSKHPDVEFLLGDIRTLRVPPGSFDAVFVHFVLHDIPAEQREGTLAALARVLVPGGRLYLREPLRFITEDEIHALCQRAGLQRLSAAKAEVPTQGTAWEAIYSRPDLLHHAASDAVGHPAADRSTHPDIAS